MQLMLNFWQDFVLNIEFAEVTVYTVQRGSVCKVEWYTEKRDLCWCGGVIYQADVTSFW